MQKVHVYSHDHSENHHHMLLQLVYMELLLQTRLNTLLLKCKETKGFIQFSFNISYSEVPELCLRTKVFLYQGLTGVSTFLERTAVTLGVSNMHMTVHALYRFYQWNIYKSTG